MPELFAPFEVTDKSSSDFVGPPSSARIVQCSLTYADERGDRLDAPFSCGFDRLNFGGKNMDRALPITAGTWKKLVDCNRISVDAGWASSGVFAPGIGPEYDPGSKLALHYVGKSAGPLGKLVASNHDQAASVFASTKWMVERRNKSAFWQMLDLIDPSRRKVAWTNICKMDEIGGSRPPPAHRWRGLSEPHFTALKEEIASLTPRVILFATSGYCGDAVASSLEDLGYTRKALRFRDGHTKLTATSEGAFAIETRHPQGWPTSERDRVVDLTRKLLLR